MRHTPCGCRSANLAQVQFNFRLLMVPINAASAAMPLFRKQSAAEQTSLAPHDSKARLRVVTKRRDSWRSHVHRTYIAQRVQLFKIETANVRGRGAEPLAFSWGSKGAILSRERMAPFAAPLRVRREKHAALPRCITRSGTLPQPPHPRSDTAARPWRKTSHFPRRIRRSSADATLSRLRFRHSPASRSS